MHLSPLRARFSVRDPPPRSAAAFFPRGGANGGFQRTKRCGPWGEPSLSTTTTSLTPAHITIDEDLLRIFHGEDLQVLSGTLKHGCSVAAVVEEGERHDSFHQPALTLHVLYLHRLGYGDPRIRCDLAEYHNVCSQVSHLGMWYVIRLTRPLHVTI